MFVSHYDIPESVVNYLKEYCEVVIASGSDRSETLEKLKGAEGIFWVTQEILDKEILDVAGNQLRSLATMSVGIDYVDLEEVKKRKIPFGNTPGVLNDAVAELAVGLAIGAGRRFHDGRLKMQK